MPSIPANEEIKPRTDSSDIGQLDFFLCTMSNYSYKDDQATMEAPIFSLATREDLKIWRWTSVDGRKSVEVIPSLYGRATIRDKDILIYATSQLLAGINSGLPTSRTVKFVAYDYLMATHRGVRGEDYRAMRDGLDRLKGTSLKTNIYTSGLNSTSSFGLIDNYRIIERSSTDARMIAIEMTLSQWLYNAIEAKEVLTIPSDYFLLRKPLERRLYEIARKHVGRQGMWKVSLATLASKCGSTTTRLRKFREAMNHASKADNLPEYRITILGPNEILFSGR